MKLELGVGVGDEAINEISSDSQEVSSVIIDEIGFFYRIPKINSEMSEKEPRLGGRAKEKRRVPFLLALKAELYSQPILWIV